MSDTTPSLNLTNALASDVEIKGLLKFAKELHIDGAVEGEILSPEGLLIVGPNAVIKGEIKTRSVTVYGKVNGNITVAERCELRGTAQLIGDLKATRLMMEEGASLIGKLDVTPNRIPLNQPVATTGFAKSAVGQ